jgi:hypothetical protein
MIESEFDTTSNRTFIASAAAKRNVRAEDRLHPGEMAKLLDAARIGGHGERNIGLIKRLAEVADSQRASREIKRD